MDIPSNSVLWIAAAPVQTAQPMRHRFVLPLWMDNTILLLVLQRAGKTSLCPSCRRAGIGGGRRGRSGQSGRRIFVRFRAIPSVSARFRAKPESGFLPKSSPSRHAPGYRLSSRLPGCKRQQLSHGIGGSDRNLIIDARTGGFYPACFCIILSDK